MICFYIKCLIDYKDVLYCINVDKTMEIQVRKSRLTFQKETDILLDRQRARTLYCNYKPHLDKEDSMHRIKINMNLIARKQGVIVLENY